MKTNKNRKSFIAVVKTNSKKRKIKATASVYRIIKNQPVFIGTVSLYNMPKNDHEIKIDIVDFLKYNGHVSFVHSLGCKFVVNVI